MRIVFMGTPEIAAGVLKSLIGSKHEVVGVVTQPDRPSGRGNVMTFSDVKKVAVENDIEVLQPQKASEPDFIERLTQMNPDVIVVVAYGQILRAAVLDLPKYGCINVHASLLPKYRGASPIQWAVINGEKETGVTIMYMAKGIDTGDIILQSKLTLDEKETAGTLHDRLTELSGPVLLEALDKIEDGTAVRTVQKEEEATYVTVIDKSLGNLDFTKPAAELERMIRGLIPWPGAFTYLNGKLLKIWDTQVSDVKVDSSFIPGRINTSIKDELYIETSDGSLRILELQAEGKKRMYASDFLLGHKPATGDMVSRDR